MSKLEAKFPVKVVRVQQPCSDCGRDNRIEVEVFTLDRNGAESVAVLTGCPVCKTGLCREDT
jgi:hypothetical protein